MTLTRLRVSQQQMSLCEINGRRDAMVDIHPTAGSRLARTGGNRGCLGASSNLADDPKAGNL